MNSNWQNKTKKQNSEISPTFATASPKFTKETSNWLRHGPAAEIEFPFSTNFGASGLAEDTYETSNTVMH